MFNRTAELRAGERVVLEGKPNRRLLWWRVGIGTAVFAAMVAVLFGTGSEVRLSSLLGMIWLYGVFMAAVVFLIDGRQVWRLTDQRLLAPNGLDLQLKRPVTVRQAMSGLVVRNGAGATLRMKNFAPDDPLPREIEALHGTNAPRPKKGAANV